MKEAEARDAYVAVHVPLPNGKVITGRPIPYKKAIPLLVLSDAFTTGGDPAKTLVPLLQQFGELTGITEEQLFALCPDLSLGEVVDLVNRFFYHRRSAPTKVQQSPPMEAPPPAPSVPSAGA